MDLPSAISCLRANPAITPELECARLVVADAAEAAWVAHQEVHEARAMQLMYELRAMPAKVIPRAPVPYPWREFYQVKGYEFGTTIYAGIPISGEDWPRPDRRDGWEMLRIPNQRQGDVLHWRRKCA